MKKIVVLGLCVGLNAFAAQYTIDQTHSTVGFKIKHLVISNVNGNFNDFDGALNFDPAHPEKLEVMANIAAKSIDTNNPKRDDHLRGADFFDVTKFPALRFVSKKVKNFKKNKGQMEGDLTLHGVTKPVVLDFQYNGANKIWGKDKVSFSGSTKINRKDFGLTWNTPIETGGFVVGDEVEINLEIEADKIEEAPAKVEGKKTVLNQTTINKVDTQAAKVQKEVKGVAGSVGEKVGEAHTEIKETVKSVLKK